MKKAIFGLLVFCGVLNANALDPHARKQSGWKSMFCLPQFAIDQRFAEVKQEVENRWEMLAVGEVLFPAYAPGRGEEELASEFYQFASLRAQMWFEDPTGLPCKSTPLFRVSQDHLLAGRFRQPNCITFTHSATDSSYNSSCISVGKRRFFALEGPIEEHVPYFFRLLANWQAAFLVCLTDEVDGAGTPKCFPYWRDRIVDGEYLRIPIEGVYEFSRDCWQTKDLRYLFWPDWEDSCGTDPRKLIEAARRVRRGVSEREIIAVHCSAGVGRTGTFIAAVCLLDAIDEQLERGIAPEDVQLSIPRLMLYLSFHRPWMIATPSQYISLYRAVEEYLND